MSAAVEHLVAEQAALHDQRAGCPAEVAQRLGGEHGVAVARRRSPSGPRAAGRRSVEPGLLGRAAGQRVLEDLVLGRRPGAGAPRRSASSPTVEAAVLGEHGGVGSAELRADLVDDAPTFSGLAMSVLRSCWLPCTPIGALACETRDAPVGWSGRSPRPAGRGPLPPGPARTELGETGGLRLQRMYVSGCYDGRRSAAPRGGACGSIRMPGPIVDDDA